MVLDSTFKPLMIGLPPEVSMSSFAQQKVRDIIAGATAETGEAGFVLRLAVNAGGCSGYSYKLSIVQQVQTDDQRLPMQGFDLVVPGIAMPLVDGLHIDFVDSPSRSGFSFTNDKIPGGACSCGDTEPTSEDALLEAKVFDVIEDIRPYLQSEGGDVSIVGVHDGVVRVRLEGACGGCSLATVTLNNVITRRLKEALPEISDVVAV